MNLANLVYSEMMDPLMGEDGKKMMGSRKKAELLNSFFASVFT